MPDDCPICRKHRGDLPTPGGPVYEDELIFAGHSFDLEGTGAETYLGHLLIEPKRHVPGLADLTGDEATLVGRLAASLARALKESEGAEHVYSAVIGHHVPHLHVHVFPRYPGTPPEYSFTTVDDWEGAPKGRADEIAAVSTRLRAQLRF
jgi:histidine triad (HIT) family protein